MYKQYLMQALALATMFSPTPQRTRKPPKEYPESFNDTINRIIELLVKDGVCSIDERLYNRICTILPNKLRGTVLFHCDIKTRNIIITYQRVNSSH